MSLLVDIRKRFPDFSLSVSFRAGNERVGLLGASGCGKSMTLKCIAGIETPDEGKIVIDGETVFDSAKKICIPPQKRRTGYLFQSYALFPTMTIEQNLAIVLRKVPSDERQRRIGEIFEKLHLEGLRNRYPGRLSGGQQQRAALARILVSDPKIVMLDEPFSALDAFLRSQVEEEVLETLQPFKGTVLFVSHDRDEVFRICDEMKILQEGRIVACGRKEDLFRNPGNLAAARLTGCKNIAEAKKTGSHRIRVPGWGLALDTNEAVPDDIAYVGIRAHHIRVPHPGETVNCFEFQVKRHKDSPFEHTEYITAIAKADPERNADDVKENLIRIVPDSEYAPAEHAEPPSDRASFVLPPEHLLLLKAPSENS